MLKRFFNWTLLTFKLFMVRLSIGLHNSEQEILKADPNAIGDKDKKNQKMDIKNPLHKKMDQGVRDDKYVKEYYEVLKKADKFMKNATPKQMEYAAMKNGMSLGKTDGELIKVGLKAGKGTGNEKLGKDKWGRRYDHFGFYDPKSKHHGKTMREVLIEETKQRVTDDEETPIEFMFSNTPIDLGLIKNDYIVEDEKYGFRELNPFEKAKKIKFPMRVFRENENAINKIEQITEYVHIKKLDKTEKVVEFFIPVKYKLFEHNEDSEVFKEIIDIDTIWLKDEYDIKFGYKITGYHKRTNVIDESVKSSDDNIIYNVIKLRARAIQNLE